MSSDIRKRNRKRFDLWNVMSDLSGECFSTDSMPSLQLPIVSANADSVFPSRLCLGSPYESNKQRSLPEDG